MAVYGPLLSFAALQRDVRNVGMSGLIATIGKLMSTDGRFWDEANVQKPRSTFMMGWTPRRRHRCAKVEVLSTT
jgi:hypothetical protein